MRFLLCFSFLITSFALHAQDKSFDIGISYGAYWSPSFPQSTRDEYYAADFEYHLSTRWSVASGYSFGRFRYYDDVRSNAPNGVIYTRDNTNAQGFDTRAYALLKYALVTSGRFNLQLGAGVGRFSQRLRYPYRVGSALTDPIIFLERTRADIEFPVSLDAYYLLTNRLGVGLKGNLFVSPDFPLAGWQIGPQLRVRL
jgi:hypothetical protein